MKSEEDYDPSDYYEDYEEYPADQRKITINWRLFLAILDVIYVIDTTVTIISILTNILHFIVLIHKTMRNNFINIIMIAICICDLLMLSVATFLSFVDILDSCETSESKFMICLDWLTLFLFDFTRRCSTYFGIFMALLRMLAMMFPMNNVISRLSNPRSAVNLILLVTFICGVYDGTYWLQYSIRNLKGKKE
uniref:G_PROTEIN_RECEP_F1_2 domain-containing protein n=1 Tax=Caenorhabditis tropicalis TaxID=1561998 RepID=A0A1I7T6R4_9PELO